MGTHVQFKKLITRAKVCTPMQNIHKLKLIDNITRSARFGKTCWSKVFKTMACNISSTIENQEQD